MSGSIPQRKKLLDYYRDGVLGPDRRLSLVLTSRGSTLSSIKIRGEIWTGG